MTKSKSASCLKKRDQIANQVRICAGKKTDASTSGCLGKVEKMISTYIPKCDPKRKVSVLMEKVGQTVSTGKDHGEIFDMGGGFRI